MDSGIIVVIVLTLFVVVVVTWIEVSSRRKRAAQADGLQSNAAVPQANLTAKQVEPARRARHNK